MTSKKPLIQAVAAILVQPDGEVLIGQRRPDQSFPGYWEFPGGKMDAGETPEQALNRELTEELGITLAESEPFGFISEEMETYHVLVLFFLSRKWNGNPKGLEGQQIRWIKKHEFSAVLFLPTNAPLLPKLEIIV